jgi:hypothetical protein
MKAGFSSETLVPTYQTTRFRNPEDSNMMCVFVNTRLNVEREKDHCLRHKYGYSLWQKMFSKKDFGNYYKHKTSAIIFAFLCFPCSNCLRILWVWKNRSWIIAKQLNRSDRKRKCPMAEWRTFSLSQLTDLIIQTSIQDIQPWEDRHNHARYGTTPLDTTCLC